MPQLYLPQASLLLLLPAFSALARACPEPRGQGAHQLEGRQARHDSPGRWDGSGEVVALQPQVGESLEVANVGRQRASKVVHCRASMSGLAGSTCCEGTSYLLLLQQQTRQASRQAAEASYGLLALWEWEGGQLQGYK